MAERLSRDPNSSVLLLEAGGSDRHPWLHIPKGSALALGSERFTWQYTADPVGPDQPSEVWVQGKVLGGSSAVNGMIYNRGWRPDYEALEQRCGPGWGWKDFVTAYRQIEDHQLGATTTRGAGGPLSVSISQEAESVCEAIISSAEALGWERVADVNCGDQQRIGYTPCTTKNGLRVSAARAFLRPARRRPNLEIMTGSRVHNLLFDGSRVVGVRVFRKGEVIDYYSSREVIASLGAIESPQLLERSGIGRADVLDRAGVALRVASPGVGESLMEHRMISMQCHLKGDVGYNKYLATRARQALAGAKYLLRRTGPLAVGYDLIGFFNSDVDADRPDGQTLFAPVSVDPARLSSGTFAERRPGLTSLVYPLRPTSRGSIHITGHEPRGAPRLVPNYLTTDHDRRVMVDLVRRHRELMAQSPIANMVDSDMIPRPESQTDEGILDFVMRHGGRAYHAVGTCSMGRDPDDVVDPDLRVRGTQGLRVVDASVLPIMVSGNSNAPVMALAWLAAERIQSDRQ